MAWYDSIGDGWLWGGSGGGSSGGFDWGSLDWTDMFGGGDGSSGGSGGGIDFGGILDNMDSWGGGSGGDSSNWLNTIGGFLGGKDGEGSIFGKMLAGGIGGMAQSLIDEKTVKEAGKQQRQTYSFQAELQDHYLQKDKKRKRAALDTFGQFSLLDRWAPNAKPAPPVDVPQKPQA